MDILTVDNLKNKPISELSEQVIRHFSIKIDYIKFCIFCVQHFLSYDHYPIEIAYTIFLHLLSIYDYEMKAAAYIIYEEDYFPGAFTLYQMCPFWYSDGITCYRMAYILSKDKSVKSKLFNYNELGKRAHELLTSEDTKDNMFGLALMYSPGIYVPQNNKITYELYSKSALLGNSQAINNLAFMLNEGVYIKENINLQYQLYCIVADCNKCAKTNKRILENHCPYLYDFKLTVQQIIDRFEFNE